MEAMLVFIAVFILVLIWTQRPIQNLGVEHDDSDPPGGYSRMLILTDHRTGLQYLTTRWGGMTPRLDKDGKHISANS